jgi:ketosteroid isomerase-like protein
MKIHDHENIKLVKRFYESIDRGDLGPARDLLDRNVEWREPDLPGVWFNGTHYGADAVWREVIEPTGARFDHFRLRMRRFYAVGDRVVALGCFQGKVRKTGKALEASTAHICTVRHGKIVKFEAFHDEARWREALALDQPELQRMAA